MATVTLRDTQQSLNDAAEISRVPRAVRHLVPPLRGLRPALREPPPTRRSWPPTTSPSSELKAEGGYVTADVINVKPETPNLDAMLNRFNKEHWHDEDEVRFIVHGRGLFHVHPAGRPGVRDRGRQGRHDPRPARHASLVRPLRGPARSAPSACSRTSSGWTPHYTDTGVDASYQPLCFGPAYIPAPGL